MIRHRSPRAAAVAVGLAYLMLAMGAIAALSLPGSAVADPQGTEPSNGCDAVVSHSASPERIRTCEHSDVVVGALPGCPVCPGGTKVVIVQRELATEARWQNAEARSAVDELEKRHPNGGLQVAVVPYSPNGARIVQRMTDRLTSVRSALSRPKAQQNPPDANGNADRAAQLAVGELRPARGEEETTKVCKLVLFFAQDSPTPG